MSEDKHTWGWHEDLEKSIWEINQKIKELEQRLLELKGYENLYDRIIGGEIFKQVPIIKELNEKIEMLKSSSHIDVTSTLLRINDATNILKFASAKDIEELDAQLQKHGHDDMIEDFCVKFAELEEKLQYVIDNYLMEFEPALTKLKELEQKARESKKIRRYIIKDYRELKAVLLETIEVLETYESIDMGDLKERLEGVQALKPDYLCNKCDHQDDSAKFGCDIEGNLAQAMLCRDFKQKEDGEPKTLDNIDIMNDPPNVINKVIKEEQDGDQEPPRLCDECHQIRHCNPIGINFYCKECELIFKCPKCNVSLNPSTTSATGDDPDETYYQCPNCLIHYPEDYLKLVAKQKEKEVDTSYYMSKAEKDVFAALDGDEEALKRISESNLIFEVPKEKQNNERFCQNCGETVGELICAKCNENTIKVYERKQEQKDIVQFLAEFKCLNDYLISDKYDRDSKEEYYNTVKEKWEGKLK